MTTEGCAYRLYRLSDQDRACFTCQLPECD
jgi:hypothetical protein